MAGYIGSKAVNLSTTGADINGDANIDGDLSFRDNDKAIFGAGSDLQIYHSGAASFISDQGTGNLKVLAQDFAVNNPADSANMITAAVGGAVTAFYNGGVKLATTSTGIDVTGTVTADSLTIAPDANRSLNVSTDGTYSLILENTSTDSGADLTFKTKDDIVIKCNNLTTFRASAGGDISFYEDTGTTPKFFWDASAESLGIGTSSPSYKLDVDGEIRIKTNTNGLIMQNNTSSDVNVLRITGGNNVVLRDSTNSDALTIDSSGNVGIGNTSSGYVFTSGETRLAVGDGSEHAAIQIYSGTAQWGGLEFADDATNGTGQGFIGYYHPSNYMQFNTSNSERMRIDSSGNVGVGITPTVRLHVYGTAGNYNSIFRNGSDSGQGVGFQRADGTHVGSITWASTTVSFNTSSDHRLKENVVDLTGATTRLKQLEPKRFNFIADAGTTVDGFLAHEVQAVVPEAITGEKDAVDADGNPEYQGIDQSKLVPLLTAALQEALDEITDLKARVATLEAN